MIRHRPHQCAAFTLFELLVALAIIGVVAAIGAPPLGDWLAKQRLASELKVLKRDLQTARQFAVMRNQSVAICASTDGLRCAHSQDWSSGWIGFANIDDDSPVQRDANEPILSRHRPSPQVQLSANRYSFRFSGDLRRATNGSIVVCDSAARVAPQRLIVSYSGRARLAQPLPAEQNRGCP